jgi:hypothetical protein
VDRHSFALQLRREDLPGGGEEESAELSLHSQDVSAVRLGVSAINKNKSGVALLINIHSQLDGYMAGYSLSFR